MASGKITTLHQGVTTDTFYHAQFSRLAQDVEITVEGGTLLSAEIYGRAADLNLSAGEKTVTIKGVPLNESSVVFTVEATGSGEGDAEENPLITNDSMASALAEHVKGYLSLRNTYDVDYRGNPELENGDVIDMQTYFSRRINALVLVNELRFDGAFHGSLKVKGLF